MGQKSSARRKKKFRTTKKALKTNGFQGFDGGDKRDRTADLLNAIQALSQLSYTPIFCCPVPDDFCIIAQSFKMSTVFLIFFKIFFGGSEGGSEPPDFWG